MKNLRISRLFAAMLFVAVLVLSGCKLQPEETRTSIFGSWVSSFSGGHETYRITFSTLENSGESGGYPYESYAGNNLCLVMTSDTSGFIYIKFTKAATASWTYSTDPSEAPDVGKWYALSFKDLTSSSVKLSAAYKAGGQTSTTTFDAAKNEFTIENGYFNTYSSCSKQ